MSDPFNKSGPQSLLCFPLHAPKPSYRGLKKGQQAHWLILDLFHETSSLQFKAISLNVQARHKGRLFYTSGMNIAQDCLSCFMGVYSKSPYGDQQYHSVKVGLLRPLLLLDGCQELILPPAGTFVCAHVFLFTRYFLLHRFYFHSFNINSKWRDKESFQDNVMKRHSNKSFWNFLFHFLGAILTKLKYFDFVVHFVCADTFLPS